MVKTKFVALLRGVNVGGNNKVEMKTLKSLFESLGFGNVLTYINSGNVIFESGITDINILTAKIESAIESEFKLKVKVLIRTAANIIELCEMIPVELQNNPEQKTDILFLWENYDKTESLNMIKATPGVDNLIYTKGAIIWSINRANHTKSGMTKFIGSELYKNMTARNVNTVRKIRELMKSDSQ